MVDDDPTICSQLERLYAGDGYEVLTAASAEEALDKLERGVVDFVVTDIRLPGMSGAELIAQIRQRQPDLPVIAITGYSDIETAVTVLKGGAVDFVLKPFNLATVQQSTRAALEKSRVYMEIRHLRRALRNAPEFGGILSKTPEMHRVFEIVRMVAPTDMTVLVEGETGTGKELVASAIHYHSPRRDGPFVTINCAGFPESLLESELFGYEKGAFTGADQSRPGKIELAHGGTLFLDEIESMSVVMQGKLLRVLEDQRVQRLGGSRSVRVDMRVIAASNVPLRQLVPEKMRTDFYYRINVIPIHLIPLRQRRVDIPLLVQDFLQHHPVAQRKGIRQISQRALSKLMDYHWPGNIRELQNVLERAIVLTSGPLIEEIDLSDAALASRSAPGEIASERTLEEWLREQEKLFLAQKLGAAGGRVGRAAEICGIGVRTLSRKLRLHGLDRRAFKPGRPPPGGEDASAR